MTLLKHLIFEESYRDNIENDIYETEEEVSNEWHRGQKHQSWQLVPKKPLLLLWATFTKYGRVDESQLEKIWEILKKSVFKIILNSDIQEGSTATNFFGKDEYDEITDEEWYRWFVFISDQSGSQSVRNMGEIGTGGNGRYSDQSRRLFKFLEAVYKTESSEQKFIAIDQLLNFVHGLGNMAKWLVEGGVSTLNTIRDLESKGIHLKGKLTEVSNTQTFMVVDVQPEYRKSIWWLPQLIEELNKNTRSVVFLYNGYDTLGMIEEDKYKDWWLDQGLDETVINNAVFYDKGYAFFRYCMDAGGLDNQTIANFVRFMYENDIRDSRDMDRERWAKYLRQYRKTDKKEVFELLQRAEDCVFIPDLMDFLKSYNNIVLCGGGIDECLREVEIALLALGKHYDVEKSFTY